MCLLTIAAYGPSLSGWFVYEDYVQPDPSGPVRAAVRWTYALTHAVAGDGPFPARVVNLGIHLLNGLLLWLVGRSVLTSAAALLAVGVFLLHPLQTESVAYLASRPELLMATWILLSCWAATSRRIWLAAGCAALAVTGKELGVMAWVLVPLWAWQTGQRWSRWELAAWTVAGAGMAALFDLALASRGWLVAPSLPYVAGQLAQLGRLVLLVGESLIHPQALTLMHDWIWITRWVAIACAGGWLLALVTMRGWWRFAVLVTLAACLPRLLLPFPDGIHERHLYTPIFAWSLAIGAALFPKES